MRLYLRISRATEESTSIERQEEGGRTEASKRWPGVPIVVYTDEDVSGGAELADRPDLTRMMKEWREGDICLFWSFDRIARGVIHFVDILKDADAIGVTLVAVSDGVDTSSPNGRFIAHILATFADFERNQIRTRTANARKYMLKVGRWTGGRVPYGLMAAPHPGGVGKTLVRDPVAALIIRRIADDMLNHDKGMTTIARELESEGVPSPRVHTSTKANPKPAAWNSRAVRLIMESPAIVGHQTDPFTGRVVRGEDGLPLTVWDPILTPAEQARITERFGPRTRRTKAGPRHRLYGVATCGLCTGNLKRSNGGNFQRDVTVFRCKGPLAAPHRPVSVRADVLDAWVDDAVLARMGHGEGLRREYVEGEAPGEDVDRLREYLAELEEDRRAGMYSTPEALARFRQSYADTAQRIATLEAQEPAQEAGWRYVLTGVPFADEWDAMDPEERGEWLRRVSATVSVLPPDVPRSRVPLEERVTLDLGDLEDVAMELDAVAADVD
ncbi:recombinase family protein [Streptomyces sp. NPDC101393]|uniref:recombinase family protein n=1 Tax=Streptomyces sp. NPDC101393 TaxID=3366141 RepID=UPI0038137A66